MLLKKRIITLPIVLCCLLQFSCTRNWEDHNATQDADLSVNLFQKIAANESLSRFTEFLKTTGYADTLQLSKSFTVWAPVNDALKSLDASIVNDPNKLKKFVAHHIGGLSYYTSQVQTTRLRIPLLDGKYAVFYRSNFDNASLSAKDQAVSNGVLHTITAAAAPVGNVWDYVDSLKTGNNMAAYIKTQLRLVFDTGIAKKTGIDQFTGQIIYDTASGMVIRNTFIDSTYNMANEAKEYTLFILNNTTWDSERARLDTFYKHTVQDSTYWLAYWNTAKDLVIPGAVAPDELPASFVSKFGVEVPLDKQAITATYRTSNGYVYVLNAMNVPLKNKFRPYVVQSENWAGVNASISGNVLQYRTLLNPNTGAEFKDLFVYNHQTNKFYVRYRIRDVPTVTYKVYWATYNNRYNNVLNQRLAIGSSAATNFPYRPIPYNVYNEEYLGDYPVMTYGRGYLDLYLVSADVAPSSSNQSSNSMFLDYIRLEPIIQ